MTMWHEARKQERIIRGLIVDYRRRAERRRDFYEKIKADPTQFLQIHGRPCKIHLDPAIAAAGESPAIMMPWQGDQQTSIDRFDVRAHLDVHDIPDIKRPNNDEITHEERYCNYERYRILAQNSFLGVDEEKFLHQLSIEEQFGVTIEEKEFQKEKAAEKKNASGVAIGYNYEDSSQPYYEPTAYKESKPKLNDEDSDEESDLEIIDVDLSIDVNKVETSQAHTMNSHGTKFGMLENDLFSFLTGDAEEAERQKQILREEKEKALFSGRKSRRERRAHRDKKLALRIVSPPHYAARPSPTHDSIGRATPSPTHSVSPEPASNAITFITSFGGEDDLPEKMTYADKVKSSEKTYASVVRDGNKRTNARSITPDLPYNRKRKLASPLSKSYSRSRRSRSRSRSSKPRSRARRSRSRSRSRKSRSRSRRTKSGSRSRRSISKSRSRRSISKSRSRRSISKSRSRRSRSRTPAKSKSNWSKSRYTPSRSRSRSTTHKRKRSISDRSSSRDSPRRRSYSRSYSRSPSSRSSSSSSSKSSDNAKRGNHKSTHSYQKSSNIGNSYNTDSNSGPVNRLPRYYGRKREGCRSSSSELSISSDDDKSNTTDKMNDNMAGRISSQISNVVRSSGASPKRTKTSSEKLSLKEKLRRKTQAQLTRQLRADKKAEAERLEREQQLLQERDDEMRELAIKIRRRQREIRHQRKSHSSEDRSSTSSKQCDKNSDSDSRDESSSKREEKKKDKCADKHDKLHSSYDVKDHKSYNDRKSDSKPKDRDRKYGSDKKYDTKSKDYGSYHSSRSSRSPPRRRDRDSDDDGYSRRPVKPLVDY